MPDPLKATHTLPVLQKLPNDLYRAIGRVVFEHSILESILLGFSSYLAGVDEVTGRLLIKGNRSTELWGLILDLAKQQGLKVLPEANINKELMDMKDMRDALAHGLFFDDPDQNAITIRQTTGAWQPPGLTKGTVKRRINPETNPVTVEAVDYIADRIADMTSLMKKVWDDVVIKLEGQERDPG